MQTAQDLISSLSYEQQQRMLEVDGEEITTLGEFLHTNLLEEDVDHISLEDAQKVIALEDGESVNLHVSEILRIS